MVDMFSTNVLVGVVANLKVTPTFLLDRFFPNMQNETTEEIHFDVDNGKRRIAPFVSPLVQGKIVESRGFTAKTYKPAYIKDKRAFDANRPLKRSMGEQIGGSLSPEERIRAVLRADLQDQIDMIQRRKVVMAAEVLRTGQVTVTGEGFPDTVVNYGRASSLSVTLSGTAKWDTTTADPILDIENLALEVLKQSGATVVDVVMGLGAWQKARVIDKFTKALDNRRATGGPVELGPSVRAGATFRGTIGDYNIWTYSDWYVDPATGTETAIMPDNEVVIAGPQLEGYQAHGAIRDEEFNYQALPFAPKSWVEKDPAQRLLLMQSAPLIVPYRVNGCGRLVVY